MIDIHWGPGREEQNASTRTLAFCDQHVIECGKSPACQLPSFSCRLAVLDILGLAAQLDVGQAFRLFSLENTKTELSRTGYCTSTDIGT